MKANRSLAISSKIQECITGLTIGTLESEFPKLIFERKYGDGKARERVFSTESALLTVVLTAIQADKTLHSSVTVYYAVRQQKLALAKQEGEREMELLRAADLGTGAAKAGRPKKHTVKLPKSLGKNISLNTAAYGKARDGVPMALIENLFKNTLVEDAKNAYARWNGYKVPIGDGACVQMRVLRQYEENTK